MLTAKCQVPHAALRSFQLRVLLHQLLQTETRELYRNLGIFPISFALIDRAFAIFWVANLLAGPEAFLAGGRLNRNLGQRELLPPRGKKLGNVVDRVVGLAGVALRLAMPGARGPGRALIFVFVGVVRVLREGVGASPLRAGEGARPHAASRPRTGCAAHAGFAAS